MEPRKNYNQILKDTLFEGVHDKGIFKAVFLAGGTGSGKDYVLNKTLDGHGLTEINTDKALEYLMDRQDLDKRMPDNEEAHRDAARKRSKNITELRQRLALHGRNGLIINGTGDDPEKYRKVKKTLERMGYETKCLFVNTSDEISKQRNIDRGQRGGRSVPEHIRKQKWDDAQAARSELAKMFRDNYVEFDNSFDANNTDVATKEEKEKEMLAIHKDVAKFVNSKPKNDRSKEWVANEMSRKDTTPVNKEAEPHPNSSAGDKARELGLVYYGFGRYGKDGKVTHRSVHDSLVQVTGKIPRTPRVPVTGSSGNTNSMKPAHKEKLTDIKSSSKLPKDVKKENIDFQFQSFLNENIPKEKHITDRNGNVRVFVLRNSAAKEAHVKNGQVHKHPKGYIVKLKEENINELYSNEFNSMDTIYSQTVPATTARELSKGRTNTKRREKPALDKPYSESHNGSGSATRTKISLNQIKENWSKKIQESIDKGIEPGLSMAGAGESPARDMGEKLSKRGKATQVVPIKELTGDETGASIGDQKEDELKKRGISLLSFKKKNYV
jgi:dephospho-CoA kinase